MRRREHNLEPSWILYISAFLVQMNAGVLGITVPIYADAHGASPFILGLIGAAGGATYSLMPIVFGALSDRFKKRTFIFSSMIFYGVSCMLYILIENPDILTLVKALESASLASFWPSIEALIADTEEGPLEETLKKFNVSWSTAMMVGPFIGGILISGLGVRTPFFFSLTISLLISLMSILFVREAKVKSEVTRITKDSASEKESLGEQTSFSAIFSSIILFSSIAGIIFSLFPAFATNLGIPAYEIGVIMLVFGMVRNITFLREGKIKSKVGVSGMFILGSFALAVASMLMANSYTSLMFALCFLAFGFGNGASYAASIFSILSRWKASRGYAAGIFESLIGVGYFIGPLIGGVVSELAIEAPYLFSFVLSLFVILIQAVSFIKAPRKKA